MQETNKSCGLDEPIVTEMEDTETSATGMCLDNPSDMPETELTTADIGPSFIHANPLVEAVLRKAYENGITVESIEDVENIIDELSSKTKIELIMAKREIDNYDGLREITSGLATASKSLSNTSKTLDDILAPDVDLDKSMDWEDIISDDETDVPDENTKPLPEDDEEASESDDEDIDKIYKSLETDLSIVKIAYDVVYQKYVEEHPNTTVYDDLLEKLLKDRSTLESSNNINAPKLIERIDDIISCMHDNNLEALLRPIHTKTDNQKRLRILAKELISTKRPVYRDLESIGITQEHIVKFVNFFIIEANFRETYSIGDIGFSDIQLIPNVCLFFLYHLCKIITNSRKRATYETLKYRLAFMHIIDVVDKYPSDPKKFTDERFEPSSDNNAGELELNDLSIVRARVYDVFVPLLLKYLNAMNDQTLIKYSKAQSKKTK